MDKPRFGARWLLAAAIIAVILTVSGRPRVEEVPYTVFRDYLAAGRARRTTWPRLPRSHATW